MSTITHTLDPLTQWKKDEELIWQKQSSSDSDKEEEEQFRQEPKEQQFTGEEQFILQQSPKRQRLALLFFMIILAVATIYWFSSSGNPAFCKPNPNVCEGIKVEALEYITNRYSKEEQILAMIQLARQMQKIKTVHQNETQQLYRNLFRSGQCAHYIFALRNSTQQFLNLQRFYTQTKQEKEKFIEIVQEFSGQPISLKPYYQQSSSCSFNSSRVQTPVAKNETQKQLTALYYINSLGSTVSGALNNLQQLSEMIKSDQELDFKGRITYMGPWRKQKKFYELISKQFQSRDQQGVLKAMIRFYENDNADNLGEEQQRIYNNFEEACKKQVEMDLNNAIENYEMDNHAGMIEQDIREGKKVVIITHSYGSKYVYHLLNNTVSDQYRTSIKLILIEPTPDLQEIVEKHNPEVYVLKQTNETHTQYLKSFQSALVSNLKIALNQAAAPVASQGVGPITVEITWDDTEDIDLHISEPDTTHVFYANPKGTVGYLDVDDLDQYGPEHYYASYDNLIQGIYKVFISYHKGEGKAKVLVRVNAGSEAFIKEVTTGEKPKGIKGSKKPEYLICVITVQYNQANKRFTYRIREE